MTTTIEVTFRRRFSAHDDQLVYNQWYKERGIDRVEAAATVEPFMGEGETIVDAYVIGEAILAPDPDETREYQAVLAAHAQARAERDLKLLAGVLPEDLPTNEELVADFFAEPPPLWPACSNCGSTNLRYDEDVATYHSLAEWKEDPDSQTIYFSGSGNYSEGTGYPGLTCESCGAALETDLEIDFSC